MPGTFLGIFEKMVPGTERSIVMKKQIKQKNKIINTDPKALLAAGLIGLKTIVPIGGIAIATALFSSCDNDTTNTVTETQIPLGNVGTVPFYRSSLANDTKASDIYDAILYDYYNFWNTPMKGNFTTRITKVYIKAGLGIGITEGDILNIGCDETLLSIGTFLHNNILTQIKQKNDIRLADNYSSAREIVGQAFGKYRSENVRHS